MNDQEPFLQAETKGALAVIAMLMLLAKLDDWGLLPLAGLLFVAGIVAWICRKSKGR